MMDNQNGPGMPAMGGFLGGLGGHGAQQLSPYLNVDPSYLASDTPEFIFNQEQSRGRMEKSFTAIGSSVITGSLFGGAYGFYDGIRKTAESGMAGKLRRTQIVNYTLKSGGSAANSLGAIAVIYSCIHVLGGFIREEDDEVKSIVSGTLTGMLYKSSAGLNKCVKGGAFGLGLASIWALFLKKDERVSHFI